MFSGGFMNVGQSIYSSGNDFDGFKIDVSREQSKGTITMTLMCSEFIRKQLNADTKLHIGFDKIRSRVGFKTSDLHKMSKIFNWAVKHNLVPKTSRNLMFDVCAELRAQKKSTGSKSLHKGESVKNTTTKPSRNIGEIKNEQKNAEIQNAHSNKVVEQPKNASEPSMCVAGVKIQQSVDPEVVHGLTNVEKEIKANASFKFYPVPQPADGHSSVPGLKDGDVYYGENRLIQGQKKQWIKPEHEAWMVAYALLNLPRENMSAKAQKQLDFLAFQAFSKVAPYDYSYERIGLQVSPQDINEGEYHRLASGFMRELNGVFLNDMQIEGSTAVLIDSPLFKDVLERYYPYKECTSESAVQQLIDASLASAKSHVIVDLSVLGSQGIERYNSLIEEGIKKYNHENNTNKSPSDLSHLHPVVFTKHQGEHIILQTEDDILDIQSLAGETGFCLSPDRAKKAFLKVSSLSDVIDIETKLATAGDVIPVVFKSVQDFTDLEKNAVLRKFQDLAISPSAPLNVRVMANSTAKLLIGLGSYDIDDKVGKEFNDLLQVAYFVIINGMNEAIMQKDDFVKFNNQIEMIHVVLQSILEVTQLYAPKDLEVAISTRLKALEIVPKNMEDPKIHLKASAMRALSSCISAVEAQNGTHSLNIAVLKDSYYESAGILEKGKSHSCTTLDGRLFDENEQAALEQLNVPIDLFVCEFHHNISVNTNTAEPNHLNYKSENIKGQIHKLLKLNDGHPLNVVLDTTVGLENSPEMKELLSDAEVQNAIRDGKLNLVLLRSAQKYDMFGQDNYYGGITTTFNNEADYKLFSDRMNAPDDQLEGINFQGLAHIHTHAGEDVDLYRKALASNCQKLYQSLERRGVILGDTDKGVKIAQTSDPNTPFIHIEGLEMDDFKTFAEENDLPLTFRASFGFINSNLSQIYEVLRLTVGLESEEIIEKYAEFLANAQQNS